MDYSPIITTTENFVRKHLAGEGTGHDWWHVERVRNTARHIQQIEGGTLSIIDLALLLHDVGDRKVIGKDDDDCTIAEDFLRTQNLDEDTIQLIMEIIKNMSYSQSLNTNEKPVSIEFQIVQDADRLDALGAIGIARAFAFGGSRGRPLYNPEQAAATHQSRDEYIKSEGSTLHHFDEKLFLLKNLLNTRAAKAIAADRDVYMHDFYQRFLDEWEGKK